MEVAGEDETDGQAGMPGAGAESGGDIGAVAAAQQGDGEVAAGGKGLGGGAGADLGAIVIEGDIADVVG